MIPIAIYHWNIGIVSRGKGKSAVAAAAYRSGEKITNEWDGMTHDYGDTVTRYTYMPSDVDLEAYDAANAAFILSADPTRTKVYMERQNGGKLLDEVVQMEGWVELDEPFVVDVIGEPLEQMPVWKFYENGACEDEIDGTMTLVTTETITLKEFLLQEYDPASGILDYDWYKAIRCVQVKGDLKIFIIIISQK